MLFYNLNGQDLLRRADLGARFSFPDGKNAGVKVRRVASGSQLDQAGLKKDDVVISLNREPLVDPDRWSDIVYSLRGGQTIDLLVNRNKEYLNLTLTLDKLAKESFPGVDVSYETVVSGKGQKIRTIITRPSSASDKLPAIFLVGGLSCSSIELYPGRPIQGWTQVLSDLVTKSGMVLMRVEKPGVGDSNGACGESNFEQDMAAFESAFNSLLLKPYVDSTQVIIYGSSMGSAIAPVLANEFSVAGIISDGTFVKSWFEHMLEIERRIQAFQGVDEGEISRKMNEGFIPLYYGMLIEKKSYRQVINEKPWLAEYNYHGDAHMYGRPVSYYHQIQDMNFAEAWHNLKVPVRIIRGTNDWIMSDADNDLIIEILEKNDHQDHQLYRYPGLDHWNMIHETALDSFTGKPGKWEDGISQVIIDFAWEMINEQH
jgi:pimeloyl-ACP methyl ester carboxylesterase